MKPSKITSLILTVAMSSLALQLYAQQQETATVTVQSAGSASVENSQGTKRGETLTIGDTPSQISVVVGDEGTARVLSDRFTSSITMLGSDLLVSPDVKNLPVREALKQIIGKADVVYDVAADVPKDIKVTLKADKITLTTALNALIESTGLGCTATNNTTVTVNNGKQTTTTKITYHITKTKSGPLSRSMPVLDNLTYDHPVAHRFETRVIPDGAHNVTIQKDTAELQKTLTEIETSTPLFRKLTGEASEQTAKDLVATVTQGLNGLKVFSVNKGNDTDALRYLVTATEERSTFTCPHCKEQVTVIKKHTTIKCPTCGRGYQDDYKFCPFDGTKRPADSSKWSFCPHCGKSI